MVAASAAGRRRRGRRSRRRQASASAVGSGGGSQHQHGPLLHRPEAAATSARPAPTRSSPGCVRSWPRSRARRLFLQAGAGHQRRRPAARTQYQYTLQDADLDELNAWAPRLLAPLQACPQLARRRHRPADQGHDADADHRPRHRVALRHPAAADRRHALRRVRPAPGRAVFHPAQQLPRRARGDAGAAGRPVAVLQALPHLAADRPAGAAVDLREGRHHQDRLPVDQPPGPVPGGDAVVQPGARRRAGRGGGRDQTRRGRHGHAGDGGGHVPGHRAGVPVVAGQRSPT